MSLEKKSSQNEACEDRSYQKRFDIVRWVIGGVFAIFSLIYGFHYSRLLLLCSAFLMLPMPFFNKRNIITVIAIILSVILFLAGVFTSPQLIPHNSSNDQTQATSTALDDDDVIVETVWVVSSGEKYHSKPSCSNMNSPKRITLESAQRQGYTACKKCYLD